MDSKISYGSLDSQNSHTEDIGYTVVSTQYSQKNINIKYPQIESFADGYNQTVINSLIKGYITDKIITDNKDYYTIDQIIGENEYKITLQTQNFLSIFFTGSTYIEGGVYPTNFIGTITFDINEAKILKLSDFMSIEENLVAKMCQSPVTAYTESAQSGIETFLQEMSDDEIIQGFNGENESFNFYLTTDSIDLIIPVAHAAGDYAYVTLYDNYM